MSLCVKTITQLQVFKIKLINHLRRNQAIIQTQIKTPKT